ncbi:MAG: DegT/DnrJ/EryC1/StrS family aminotransferase [Planctomycetota bacterium]|nr:DegT/DnrJ/EryC1/StrS family aminotransferase [Planctomycetota bacterium]
MATQTTASSQLAVHGGTPCVVDRPADYLIGPQEIGQEEIDAVTAVLKQKNLFRFFRDEATSPTAQFEKLFGELSGAKYVLAVNSGTSALIAAMVGLGVSSGDEVIVPAYTYIATAAAVLTLKAIPIIAEVDESLTLDPKDVEKKITSKTRLIIPVHMRGTPCRMDEIMAVAKRHKVRVLEDCAQANGGQYKGKALGTIGDAGAFSLQHFKIITAGEGGAVVTNTPEVFQRAACYHDSAYAFWKSTEWQIEPFLGENYRMSELNGALALAQLRKRERILSRLRELKKRLWSQVENLPGVRFQDVPDKAGDCGLSLVFFVESPERAKAFAAALRAEGMAAGSMFDQGFPDRHIYYHWDYIMQKRTPDLHGYPWNLTDVKYTPDMCPQTIHLLSRAVAVSLTQVMSDAHIDSCAVALKKVAAGL